MSTATHTPTIVDAARLRIECMASDTFAVTFVLTQGVRNDFAAYYGKGTEGWVAQHGIKAPLALAQAMFPWAGLNEGNYRQ